MILFDTSVIIDARDADSPFHAWAKERIAEAVAGDGASANTIVVSEASVRANSGVVAGSGELIGYWLAAGLRP